MLLRTITLQANRQPERIALRSDTHVLTYAQLNHEIVTVSMALAKLGENSRCALAMQNSAEWVTLDIAMLALGLPHIPLPSFFSESQLRHAVTDSGANILLTDTPERFKTLFSDRILSVSHLSVLETPVCVIHLEAAVTDLPQDTVKITYTSGTTGEPKGVCLSKQAMLAVADSLKSVVNIGAEDRHLCVLPLSTLLENVAGVYATLLGGGQVHLLPASKTGLDGSKLDIRLLHQALLNSHATTAILIPELLKALVLYCGSGAPVPTELRFLAVGGAHVATHLLERARTLGIPVYEGYGLSENASVASVNTPQANKLGSVGRALPHMEIICTEDHEIWVKGSNFLGYTHGNVNASRDGFLPTGDLGVCDEEGFWFIRGRKKNMFITSFGRNVSPEWVETELSQSSAIAQACLFGEARPFNTAVIVTKPDVSAEKLALDIQRVNQLLPDYARITKWIIAEAPFSPENQQLTINGRLKRDAIWEAYQHKIEPLYMKELA